MSQQEQDAAAPAAVPTILDAETATDPDALDRLTRVTGRERDVILFTVARNPHTRAATLTRLAGERLRDIRWAVASNPRTSAGTLDRLTRDTDPLVLDKAEDETLRRMMRDPSHVAARWGKLAEKISRDYRLAAPLVGTGTVPASPEQWDAYQRLLDRRHLRRLQHAALTGRSRVLLTEFWRGGNPMLLRMLVRNPACPRDVLVQLEKNRERDIALAAFKRLNVPALAVAGRRAGQDPEGHPLEHAWLTADGWGREEIEKKHPGLVEKMAGLTIQEDIRRRGNDHQQTRGDGPDQEPGRAHHQPSEGRQAREDDGAHEPDRRPLAGRALTRVA